VNTTIAAFAGDGVDIFTMALGGIISAVSVLVAANSLFGIARRHRAEQQFHAALANTLSRYENYFQAREALLKGADLAEEGTFRRLNLDEQYELRQAIDATLERLAPQERKLIQRAWEQPNVRGRQNYFRRVLAESTRILRSEGAWRG
jgi:biopolymer transport protein ExbB/TolQ